MCYGTCYNNINYYRQIQKYCKLANVMYLQYLLGFIVVVIIISYRYVICKKYVGMTRYYKNTTTCTLVIQV